MKTALGINLYNDFSVKSVDRNFIYSTGGRYMVSFKPRNPCYPFEKKLNGMIGVISECTEVNEFKEYNIVFDIDRTSTDLLEDDIVLFISCNVGDEINFLLPITFKE